MIDPKDAWQRIKEAKHLNKQARGVAQALAEWRELAAQKNDIPNRYIMSDLALVGIAQRKPTKLSDLKNIRGFDYSQYQKEKGQHLLKSLKRVLRLIQSQALKVERNPCPLRCDQRLLYSLPGSHNSQLTRTSILLYWVSL